MADVKVLHKKTCPVPFADSPVYVKQFLIVEENGVKYLIPRFVNARAENVTAVRVSVEQYDADGEQIARSTARVRVATGGGALGKPFVPDDKIALTDETCDCKVKVVSAEYGDFTYRTDGRSVAVEFNGGADELDDDATRAAYSAKAGKSGITVAKRTAKTPVLVIFALIVALALAVGAVYAHLKYFVAHEKTFLYSGVEYAFEDDDKSDGSNIIAVGYHGGRSRIVIPASIEGHKVIGVADNAFKGDKSLTSVGFASNIPIGAGAFDGCINLREAEFAKITEFGAGAFRNCKKLESAVIGEWIDRIPQEAFAGCSALETITIERGDDDIEIGKNAFARCGNIKTAEILRDIDFTYNSGNYGWFTGAAIGRLHITSYKVNANAYNTSIASMFGIDQALEYSDAQIKELSIDRLDNIPSYFCTNLPLASFEVKSLNTSTVGANAFARCGNLSKLSLPQPITRVEDGAFNGTALTAFNGSALTMLGNSAFGDCRNLKTFTVANNAVLETIGANAFNGCSALTAFTIPRGVTKIRQGTFANCSALAEIKYARGTSLDKIGDDAFNGCVALKEFKLPDENLIFIGARAFKNCTSLAGFDVTENVAGIGDNAFQGCTAVTSITLPDSVISFGNGALRDCSALTELTVPFIGGTRYSDSYLAYTFGATSRFSAGSAYVPQSLVTVTLTDGTALDNSAFYGCSDIIEINLPQTLERIGQSAFAGCNSLAAIDLPTGVTSVSDGAFNGCSALSALTIPSGVTEIGFDAFGKCSALTKLSVPFVGQTQTTNVFLSYVFGNRDYMSGGSAYVPSSLETVEVTNAVTIGYYAFKNCAYIREIILRDGLSAIGRCAFDGCDSLKSLVVPNSVTTLASGAFYGSSFEELALPFVGRERVTSAEERDETKRLSYNFTDEYYFIPAQLKKIALTDSTFIGENAFSGLYFIEQVVLDCDVEYIASDAFSGCHRLFEVFNFGDRLNIVKGSSANGGIAQYALKVHTDRNEEPLAQFKSDKYRFVRDDDGNMHMLDCAAEENLVLPNAVYFDGVNIERYSVWRRLFAGNGVIKSVVIPASVTDLGAAAFSGCNNLERAEFAANSPIAQINEETFFACTALYDLTLPQRLTRINGWAFCDCSRLKKITVPRGVTEIADGAFLTCSRLFEIYNHSGLDIVVGSTDNGCIAEHARAVYNDDSQSIDSVTVNGTQYMQLGDGGISWWAVDYYGDDGAMEIKPFAFDGATVERIGIYDGAFKNNSKIISVVISNAVAVIGDEFDWCYNLAEVKLTGGGANEKIEIADGAFANCYGITRVVVDTPVSVIGKNAFLTDNLISIEFSARVDRVSSEAFFGSSANTTFSATFADVGTFESNTFKSTNVRSLKATGTVDGIAQNAFYGQSLQTVEFADVGEIGAYAFSSCNSLKTVKFGDVGTINDSAFYATGMNSATFGRVGAVGVQAFASNGGLNRISFAQSDNMSIGNYAFASSALAEFVYRGKMSAIGSYAFSRNTRLNRLVLGETGAVGNNAFSDCTALRTVEFTGNVDAIGDQAFGYTPITSLTFGGKVGAVGARAFRSVNITNLIFANDIGTIGQLAFADCGSLKTVQFNGALTTLGDRAFSSCYALDSVKLPSALRTIDEYTFGNCGALTEIVVPDGVTTIRAYAFYNCSELHRIELPSSLTSLSANAFDGCEYILAVRDQSRLNLADGGYFGDALVVSSDAARTTVEYHIQDAFRFAKTDGEWYLYNITYSYGSITVLPTSFRAGDAAVSSYKLRGGATRNIYNGLLISKSVKGLRRGAVQDGMTVYFDGTAGEWSALEGSSYVSSTVLYRSDCLHEGSADGLWRYDEYGNPTRAYTIFDETAWTVTVQPTCTKTGVRETTCPHCKRKITESVPTVAHSFGADDKCTVCGKQRIVVKSDNIASISAIRNDANYPFAVSASGEISSTNKRDGSSASFMVVADKAMTVSFDIRVSSEDACDRFIVRVNDQIYYDISGTDSVTGITAYLASGDELRFTYSKDVSESRGNDCGYITDLTLIYTED